MHHKLTMLVGLLAMTALAGCTAKESQAVGKIVYVESASTCYSGGKSTDHCSVFLENKDGIHEEYYIHDDEDDIRTKLNHFKKTQQEVRLYLHRHDIKDVTLAH